MFSISELPRWVKQSALALLLFAVLIYLPVGMVVVHEINDHPKIDASQYDFPGGSHAVAVAAALIERETVTHHFTPNDPFWLPGAWLDRMPAFQRGVIAGLSRFAVELSDQVGRTRGSSQVDPDLEKAAGLLKFSPHVWVFDFSTSLLPTTPSHKQYQAAMRALIRYNQRLSKNEAVFDKRADNLMETLDRMATDMGSASAMLDGHVERYSGTLVDLRADEIFYFIKGRLYANTLIIRALGKDFADIIREKGMQNTWQQTLATFEEASSLSHFFVFNASPNSQFLPNHLTGQGFYLMRARTQLREITNILLK